MSEITQSRAQASRHEQTFPVFNAEELDRLRPFGSIVRFKDGDQLLKIGEAHPGMLVILSGHATISARNGFGRVTPLADYSQGQFIAEIGNLSGVTALVDGFAEGETETLIVSPEQLRSLLIANAEIGERIMRALILRRVSLIEGGATGPVLIGSESDTAVIRLQGFFRRNGYPHVVLDPAGDPDAAELLSKTNPSAEDLPLVLLSDGTILRNPPVDQIAAYFGMSAKPRKDFYDVAVVGAGPGGLSTAVYAASEGLSVAVCDERSFGGQAGASSRIENYFGFPTGISGFALTARAYSQAQKFGAEMLIPTVIGSLDCSKADGYFALKTEDGHSVRARSIVIASGASYRRPDIDGLTELEGRGIWYWASPLEAKLCENQEVYLVGGGNSAGQAVVYLAGHARSVKMLVRGPSLAASMSSYLIERIEAAPNVEILYNTEVSGFASDTTGLSGVVLRNTKNGSLAEAETRNLFLFIGADPATGWLQGCGVTLDKAGFVVTSAKSIGSSELETAVPGVFAAGDVRSGSTKRVGSAIGEGAQAVAAVHRYLSTLDDPVVEVAR